MSDLGPPKIFSFSELAAMEMERDAALARAEAAHVRLVEVIKGVQHQLLRLAKHALRYRSLLKDSRTFLKQADFQRDVALAECDRLRAAVAAADAVLAMLDDENNSNWFRHTEAADAYRTARKQIEGK